MLSRTEISTPSSGVAQSALKRITTTRGALLILFYSITAIQNTATAQGGPSGITTPIVLPPFIADAPACTSPPGLRKVLAFAQDNERQFIQGVARGLAMAAKDRGLEYRVALANNDPKKMIEQVDLFQASQVGAVVAAPVDPPSLSQSLQKVIWAGGYVGLLFPLLRPRC